MSTGGPDDPMLEVDGDMHRLTPRLRWQHWNQAHGVDQFILSDARLHGGRVLEQAWQNVRTGALVWRPVEIDP